ncbi:MAG: hypothetical protein PHU05_02315 [Bacilli bacterium]|nr:hypothetical protein [Bacilli bacterium]
MIIKYLSDKTIELLIICLTIIIVTCVISSIEKKGIDYEIKQVNYCQDVYTHEDIILESCK